MGSFVSGRVATTSSHHQGDWLLAKGIFRAKTFARVPFCFKLVKDLRNVGSATRCGNLKLDMNYHHASKYFSISPLGTIRPTTPVYLLSAGIAADPTNDSAEYSSFSQGSVMNVGQSAVQSVINYIIIIPTMCAGDSGATSNSCTLPSSC